MISLYHAGVRGVVLRHSLLWSLCPSQPAHSPTYLTANVQPLVINLSGPRGEVGVGEELYSD